MLLKKKQCFDDGRTFQEKNNLFGMRCFGSGCNFKGKKIDWLCQKYNAVIFFS